MHVLEQPSSEEAQTAAPLGPIIHTTHATLRERLMEACFAGTVFLTLAFVVAPSVGS